VSKQLSGTTSSGIPLPPWGCAYIWGYHKNTFWIFCQNRAIPKKTAEFIMAKQPNLEKAKLETEAYSKKIRNMIDALNSDLVDLKVKDSRIKLIPVKKEDTPRKMFGTAIRTMQMGMDYIAPAASQAVQERIKNRFQQIQRERMKFMGRASMQAGAKKTLKKKKASKSVGGSLKITRGARGDFGAPPTR